MPSRFNRENPREGFDDFSRLIKSPESRGILFKIVGLIAAAALVWVVIGAILSLLNVWLVILLVLALGAVVYFKEWQKHQRELRIQQGYCAACGYDLRATPEICPECGRDARLDEPIWRRMRRELEAKLLADSAAVQPIVESPPQLPEAQDPKPMVRVVTKRPEADDTPIPLEGD